MNTIPIICPACRATVSLADAKFCPYCGRVLRISTSVGKQTVVYLVSVLLPPFGLWFVWKYLRQGDRKSKIIGIVAAILTVIALIATIWLGKLSIDALNQAVNSSLGDIGF